MNFQPISVKERLNLEEALRANAFAEVPLKMDPKTTEFTGMGERKPSLLSRLVGFLTPKKTVIDAAPNIDSPRCIMCWRKGIVGVACVECGSEVVDMPKEVDDARDTEVVLDQIRSVPTHY